MEMQGSEETGLRFLPAILSHRARQCLFNAATEAHVDRFCKLQLTALLMWRRKSFAKSRFGFPWSQTQYLVQPRTSSTKTQQHAVSHNALEAVGVFLQKYPHVWPFLLWNRTSRLGCRDQKSCNAHTSCHYSGIFATRISKI